MLALSGHADEAGRILKDLTTDKAPSAISAEAVGMIHAGLGDMDSTFAWFERAAAEGGYLLAFLNVSPLFDSLRSHERFGALQRLLRLA
jgi:hypothetical protein